MDTELNLINDFISKEIISKEYKSDNNKIKNKITIIDDTSNKNIIKNIYNTCEHSYNNFDKSDYYNDSEKSDKSNKSNKSDDYNNSEKTIKYDSTIICKNKPINLIINGQVVNFRKSDNYINASQLCVLGKKNFGYWYSLDSTKEIINELSLDIGIQVMNLIEQNNDKNNDKNNSNDIWIHPDLAIQLAQWLCPKIGIKVTSLIREMLTENNHCFDLKILKEKDNVIKEYQKRIKVLEDLTLKRHRRTKYNDSNIVYIITDKDNKKNRIYIIGSTIDLTKRLSTYNKGIENEVIYYRGFETEEEMEKAEQIVLTKLNQYREKANRDRVVLPIGENIKLFTDAIDKAYYFFYL